MDYTNDSYVLHRNIRKKFGYEYFNEDNGEIWLKVFHQNTKFCYFNSRAKANYSLNKNCYSILREVDQKFLISKSSQKYYSFLLEYPQIPEYIEFIQTELFTTTNPNPNGFEIISNNSYFEGFGGLHQLDSKYLNRSLIVGYNNGFNWFYPIGTISKQYYPFFPIDIQKNYQVADLWIELPDLNLINTFKYLISDCNISNYYNPFFVNWIYLTFYIFDFS